MILPVYLLQSLINKLNKTESEIIIFNYLIQNNFSIQSTTFVNQMVGNAIADNLTFLIDSSVNASNSLNFTDFNAFNNFSNNILLILVLP